MKKSMLISMITLATVCFTRPAAAQGAVTTYQVDWPAKQLDATFTLLIGSAFSLYHSTEAAGILGTGSSLINVTNVGFWAQPNFAELYIYGQQRSEGVFYIYPPVAHNAYVSWANANEAWQSLVTQGAANGLTISIVPEPASLTLVGFGSLALLLFRRKWVRPWGLFNFGCALGPSTVAQAFLPAGSGDFPAASFKR